MQNWNPASPAQREFVNSLAQFTCGGGAAGTYKTESLLVDAVHEYENPRFNGVLFRTTFPELQGKIIPRSRELYSQMGGLYNETEHFWQWPWGARMKFSYLGRDNDVYAHQGSEYSWIGFDEGTHRTEFQIRYLLSRLRSTDTSLFCRVRDATNPGGPSHDLHSHVFLGGVCPHCQPAVRRPNIIYKDATWLSDKKPLEMTTQYIFSRWDPDGLLPDYDRQLRMQSGGIAKALLEGCWRSFEGQYYDIWEPDRVEAPMVIPRQSIGDDWYWAHWIGADYGFSGSSAVAYLFAVSPSGVTYCVDEYVSEKNASGKGEDVKAFTRSVYDRFCAKKDWQEQPRKIVAMYLSPDCWNDRGDYHTLASQMNETLKPHGLGWIKAKNDRAGGAMLIYTMLQTGRLVIANTCKTIQQSLESRIHDPKEPEKVLKIIGNKLDDAFDGFRYGIYSYEQPLLRPLEIRIKEKMDELWTVDPTTAMFKASEMIEQEKKKGQPTFYGGRGRNRG